MSNLVATQVTALAKTLSVDASAPAELVAVLKATAFKGQVSDAQMTALLVVANQYGLNPWTKEIYAFPDKNNGIVPVVGVDGWSRIINSAPAFDGMDFEQDAESCTCIIYRKDRSHPVRVTEWLAECKRDVAPWRSHPKRMLRHKAMIQCARLAFGFVGIYEQDEAERIVESIPGEFVTVHQSKRADVQAAIPHDSPEREALTADLFAVADNGMAELERLWKGLAKESRALVMDRLPMFKEHAAKADAKLAEVVE
jgi:phage recombination protein Bet